VGQYFYDKQIRRFMSQFIRIFDEMYVEYGKDPNGNSVLYRVPVRYADTNRQVSSILKSNSDNTVLNVPMIVCYITKIDYDRPRIQEPKYVDNKSLRTRTTDPLTGNVTSQQGQNYSLNRLMPAPYRMTVNMEIWTSNQDQKHQLWEQISPMFNPDMELQSTDNYFDWTSLSYVILTSTNWTTRDIPIGADDPIDVATMTFEMPIWFSTPAKIKRLGIVQSVVSNIYDANGNPSTAIIEAINNLGNRQYFTPTGYQVIVNKGNISLLPTGGPVLNNTNYSIPTTNANSIAWAPVINYFGNIANNYSMMYLTNSTTERLVTGTVAYDPNNQNNLFFNVDPATIPTNILPSVNAIVDPKVNGPGVGLPAASTGQRYLIVSDLGGASLGNGAASWQNANTSITNAVANDIIQYNGSSWYTAYRPNSVSNASYVTNTFSSVQYAWDGSKWVKSWEGLYPEGLWSIVI
jgi:T4-like virus Myoviridae tail sheath stabiliser